MGSRIRTCTQQLKVGLSMVNKYWRLSLTIFAPAFILFIFAGENAHADFVFTKCTKWTEEGFGLFECSNEKAYAVGNAICSTTDSRRIKNNTSHPERPTEIFCSWRNRENPEACLNDSRPEVEVCYKEYVQKSTGGQPARAPAPKTVTQ